MCTWNTLIHTELRDTGSSSRPETQYRVHEMGFELLYYIIGFETCFGWDPRHQRCWDSIAKHISNPYAACCAILIYSV